MRKDQYVWQQTAQAPPDEFKKQTICIPGSASPSLFVHFPGLLCSSKAAARQRTDTHISLRRLYHTGKF